MKTKSFSALVQRDVRDCEGRRNAYDAIRVQFAQVHQNDFWGRNTHLPHKSTHNHTFEAKPGLLVGLEEYVGLVFV